MNQGPIRDTQYETLHDQDPVDYHTKLAALHITCGFCERRRKLAEAVTRARSPELQDANQSDKP